MCVILFLYILFDLYWRSAANETPSCANTPNIYNKALLILHNPTKAMNTVTVCLCVYIGT